MLIADDVERLLVKIFLAFRPDSNYETENGNVGANVELPLSNRAFQSALRFLKAMALLNGSHSVTREMFPYLVGSWANRLVVKPTYGKPRESKEAASARLIKEVIDAVLKSE